MICLRVYHIYRWLLYRPTRGFSKIEEINIQIEEEKREVGLGRLELPALGLGNRCSIH
jgi:hypothetical protein